MRMNPALCCTVELSISFIFHVHILFQVVNRISHFHSAIKSPWKKSTRNWSFGVEWQEKNTEEKLQNSCTYQRLFQLCITGPDANATYECVFFTPTKCSVIFMRWADGRWHLFSGWLIKINQNSVRERNCQKHLPITITTGEGTENKTNIPMCLWKWIVEKLAAKMWAT